MRVVLDTNIIVAGLLWKGATREIFEFVERGEITICLTPKIVSEVERVLSYPKIEKQLRRGGLVVGDVLAYVLEKSLLVEDVEFVKLVVDDPSDDMFYTYARMRRGEKTQTFA